MGCPSISLPLDGGGNKGEGESDVILLANLSLTLALSHKGEGINRKRAAPIESGRPPEACRMKQVSPNS